MDRALTRRGLVAAAPAAVVVAVVAGASTLALASTEDGDAVLLELNREWAARRQRLEALLGRFENLSSDERAASYAEFSLKQDELYCDLFEVQDRIVATPARTLAGLQIKARIVVQDHDNDIYGTDLASIELMLGNPDITEGRAGLSLAADILRLAKIA